MHSDDYQRRGRLSTAGGVVAILLWSGTIAVSRSLAEEVGAMTAAAAMLSAGGVLGCLYAAAIERRLGAMLRLPPAYLAGCGGLFVAYMACLYLAIGLAASRRQTIEVGIINYLWPGLTLALAVPILHAKVRATFWLGVAMAVAGAALAPLRLGEYSAPALVADLRANPLPYVFALGAGVTWALYSVLSRRWGGAAEGGAVPLFALASGLVLGLMRLAMPEESHWTGRAVAELVFMAVFPILIAYVLWDRAMRRGNVTLVAALSYFIPLASTFVSGLYLDVPVGRGLWLACGLVVAGAALAAVSCRSKG